MSKVRCSGCKYEVNGFCTLKNNGVARRKRRNCEDFILDPSKVKQEGYVPTIRLPYLKQQEIKNDLKEKMKKVKELVKKGKTEEAENLLLGKETLMSGINRDEKYPLTGDLSRFTTTAEKEDD